MAPISYVKEGRKWRRVISGWIAAKKRFGGGVK